VQQQAELVFALGLKMSWLEAWLSMAEVGVEVGVGVLPGRQVTARL